MRKTEQPSDGKYEKALLFYFISFMLRRISRHFPKRPSETGSHCLSIQPDNNNNNNNNNNNGNNNNNNNYNNNNKYNLSRNSKLSVPS